MLCRKYRNLHYLLKYGYKIVKLSANFIPYSKHSLQMKRFPDGDNSIILRNRNKFYQNATRCIFELVHNLF